MEEKQTRDITVAYRLSPEEKRQLEELSKSYKLNTSELFRRMMNYISRELPPLADVATASPN